MSTENRHRPLTNRTHLELQAYLESASDPNDTDNGAYLSQKMQDVLQAEGLNTRIACLLDSDVVETIRRELLKSANNDLASFQAKFGPYPVIQRWVLGL